jgi:replicative DNA helicase
MMGDEKKPQSLFNQVKSGQVTLDELLARPAPTPVTNSGASLNRRTYTSKAVVQREKQYEQEKALRLQANENKLSFIGAQFDHIYQLTQGLVLVGARSGHAKSTTAASVVASFLTQCDTGSVVVISNEESSESTLNRIACVLLKKNFKHMHRGVMAQKEQAEVRAKVSEIITRVEVVDDEAWDMTDLSDVQAVLEFAAKGGVRLVVVDYLQTVAFCKDRPHLEPFQVSKLLGLYLKDYGKRIGIPVVVFAQLKPEGEGSGDFSSRVQGDRTIYNHAFAAIEIVPDFKNSSTKFIFHKNRFGTQQGLEMSVKFTEGRYGDAEVEL